MEKLIQKATEEKILTYQTENSGKLPPIPICKRIRWLRLRMQGRGSIVPRLNLYEPPKPEESEARLRAKALREKRRKKSAAASEIAPAPDGEAPDGEAPDGTTVVAIGPGETSSSPKAKPKIHAQPPASAYANLPMGWSATVDEGTGKTYWFHSITNEVTWTKPALGVDLSAVPDGLIAS